MKQYLVCYFLLCSFFPLVGSDHFDLYDVFHASGFPVLEHSMHWLEDCGREVHVSWNENATLMQTIKRINFGIYQCAYAVCQKKSCSYMDMQVLLDGDAITISRGARSRICFAYANNIHIVLHRHKTTPVCVVSDRGRTHVEGGDEVRKKIPFSLDENTHLDLKVDRCGLKVTLGDCDILTIQPEVFFENEAPSLCFGIKRFMDQHTIDSQNFYSQKSSVGGVGWFLNECAPHICWLPAKEHAHSYSVRYKMRDGCVIVHHNWGQSGLFKVECTVRQYVLNIWPYCAGKPLSEHHDFLCLGLQRREGDILDPRITLSGCLTSKGGVRLFTLYATQAGRVTSSLDPKAQVYKDGESKVIGVWACAASTVNNNARPVLCLIGKHPSIRYPIARDVVIELPLVRAIGLHEWRITNIRAPHSGGGKIAFNPQRQHLTRLYYERDIQGLTAVFPFHYTPHIQAMQLRDMREDHSIGQVSSENAFYGLRILVVEIPQGLRVALVPEKSVQRVWNRLDFPLCSDDMPREVILGRTCVVEHKLCFRILFTPKMALNLFYGADKVLRAWATTPLGFQHLGSFLAQGEKLVQKPLLVRPGQSVWTEMSQIVLNDMPLGERIVRQHNFQYQGCAWEHFAGVCRQDGQSTVYWSVKNCTQGIQILGQAIVCPPGERNILYYACYSTQGSSETLDACGALRWDMVRHKIVRHHASDAQVAQVWWDLVNNQKPIQSNNVLEWAQNDLVPSAEYAPQCQGLVGDDLLYIAVSPQNMVYVGPLGDHCLGVYQLNLYAPNGPHVLYQVSDRFNRFWRPFS